MRLVVQGRQLSVAHLTHIHRLVGGHTQFMQIGEFAYYLPTNATEIDAVKQFCSEQQIDCALVPDAQRLQQFGLCVMDMDSTLISIECIDEIADIMGIKPQISAITEAAMRGELDFASSLRKRVALLKGLPESALQRVVDERLQLGLILVKTITSKPWWCLVVLLFLHNMSKILWVWITRFPIHWKLWMES
jgi:phosphoserine phosphatase